MGLGLGLVAEKSNDLDTGAHSLEPSGHQEQALAATEEARRLPDNFEQAQQFTRAGPAH